MPAVFGCGDILEPGSVRNCGNTPIVGSIADTDVDRTTLADNLHSRPCELLRSGFRLRLRLLPNVILSNRSHKRGMSLVTVLAVLLDSGFLLESLHDSFRFATKLTIYLKGGT